MNFGLLSKQLLCSGPDGRQVVEINGHILYLGTRMLLVNAVDGRA